jgi:hypothetical protein
VPLAYDYTPMDYRDVASPAAALMLNVKGDLRRRLLRDILSGRHAAGLDPALLAESASDLAHGILGRVHPQWMGGEFLPDYLDGETEIARVTLATVTRDVLSLRARRRSGRFLYRLVDEYGVRWRLTRASSAHPLPMRGVIQLLDTACLPDARWPDLTDELRDAHGGEPAEAAQFVEVTSDVYPGLEAHYRMRAEQWLARRAGNVPTWDVPVAPEDDDEDRPWAP